MEEHNGGLAGTDFYFRPPNGPSTKPVTRPHRSGMHSPGLGSSTMSQARALLKAKRQEARVDHPYASYNNSGQLKCSICGTVVKHAFAWEGHIGSKAHRTNIIRLREEENRKQLQLQLQENHGNDGEREEEAEETVLSKRKASDDEDASDTHSDKKRKLTEATKGFPADFFSDPSRAPVLLSDDSENEESPSAIAVPTTDVDLEYERFQRELLSVADPVETFKRATIVAEPVAAPANVGFPLKHEDVPMEEAADQNEDELRQKREQDEKELIMDRLLEEERAQEDADTRVLLLKNKIELMRRKRQEAKVNKLK